MECNDVVNSLIDEFKIKLPKMNLVDSEKTVYKKYPWIELSEQIVRDQNDHKTNYIRIKRPNFSMILLKNKLDQILFQLRYRLGSKSYVLELPAGICEEEENAEECAHRELKEELGISNVKLEFLNSCYLDAVRSECNGYFFMGIIDLKVNPKAENIEGELEESTFFWMEKSLIKTTLIKIAI